MYTVFIWMMHLWGGRPRSLFFYGKLCWYDLIFSRFSFMGSSVALYDFDIFIMLTFSQLNFLWIRLSTKSLGLTFYLRTLINSLGILAKRWCDSSRNIHFGAEQLFVFDVTNPPQAHETELKLEAGTTFFDYFKQV